MRIGILGARSWIANRAVIPAIEACLSAELVAVAASGGPVPENLAALDVATYDGVLSDPRVEAVYIPLPNGLHRYWVERAAAAGKHVLCEKPLGLDASEAAAMAASCAAHGVILAEAWMTPFGARFADVVALAGSGALGDVRYVGGDFTFTIDASQAANYRWEIGQGGGALLDVGIYALGAAVALWGAEPLSVVAMSNIGPTGVDLTTSAWCDWGQGRSAAMLVSFELPEAQRLEIVGTAGRVVVDGPAFTGGAEAASYSRQTREGVTAMIDTINDDPYYNMIQAFALAVRGIQPWPRPPAETIAFALLLDRIRTAAKPANPPAP